MRFSSLLWKAIEPIYDKIIHHPFNVQLADGTLDRGRFAFYIEQDSYYLVHFSRALALIAGRATSPDVTHRLLHFSLGALVAERELHAHFLPANHRNETTEPSPSCLGYTQYLTATAATAPLEEAIAAVLPCFWIYREVGHQVARYSVEANPYERWIETYSSQPFSDDTDQAIALLDELAKRCLPDALERMKRAFECSSLFEWHFWNDAYRMTSFRAAVALEEPILLT